jgi:carbamoyl-phosphate synthase large subunit
VFISMTDKYKPFIVPVAQELTRLGFGIVATRGTAAALAANGVKCDKVFKISEGR